MGGGMEDERGPVTLEDGAPYNRLKALEYAWRYELSRNASASR